MNIVEMLIYAAAGRLLYCRHEQVRHGLPVFETQAVAAAAVASRVHQFVVSGRIVA